MWFKKKESNDEKDDGQQAKNAVHDLISFFEKEKKEIFITHIQKNTPAQEVRAVFIDFQEKYRLRVEEIENQYHDEIWEQDELEEIWDEFKRRSLEECVDRETKKYIRRIKKSPTIDDVFAQAGTKQNHYSEKLSTEAKATLMTCNSCGAARIDINQYDTCTYCGQPLFTKKKYE